MLCAMKSPLYIRHVTDDEPPGCTVVMISPYATARYYLRALRDKNRRVSRRPGVVRRKPCATCSMPLTRVAWRVCSAESNVPITVEPVLNAEKRERLRAILHQSPRTFGQPASVWTLKRLAAVCHEQGLSPTTLSCPTMLEAIIRLGVSWQRAKHWMVSPDPAYTRKKTPGPPDPDGRHPSGHRAGL